MLQLVNLDKSFGDHQVFTHFSYSFEAGKIYALIGKSGSGKTTLMNMMAKLEPYDDGKVIYKGKPLESYREQTFFHNELGYLFQNLGLIENATVEDNLKLGIVGKRSRKKEQKALFEGILHRVGLSYIATDRKIYTLSGGEAQRVSLAKLMLKDPSLLLADEPTASLDPDTSEEILRLLFRMRHPRRLIILATHNPAIWEKCDEIVQL